MENRQQILEIGGTVYATEQHRIAGFLLSLAAAGFTALIFLVLPLSELLAPSPRPVLDIREVDASAWKPPAPPRVRLPRPPKPRPKEVTLRPKPVAPRLRTPPRTFHPQLRLPASLALDMSLPVGDFGLNFQVRPAPPPEAVGPPAQAVKTVFTADGVDQAPRPVAQAPPIYPYQARLHRIEGFVDVRFTVSRDGSTADIQVAGGQPAGTFDTAAAAAVARWRFEPGKKDGKPVPTRLQVRIRFKLRR